MTIDNPFSDPLYYFSGEPSLIIREIMKTPNINTRPIVLALAVILLAISCSAPHPPPKVAVPPSAKTVIPLGYTIQVGAFSRLDNAAHLVHALQKRGIWAFYFRDSSGLYKVRFGNFPTKTKALRKAKALYSQAIIGSFYIVKPRTPAGAILDEKYKAPLRKNIVRTAKSFIGIPYRWGGTSKAQGFDCSGFTMAVYQLNGLNLPRSSYQQWLTGIPIPKNKIKKGDLVFFATTSYRHVSHVGIYVGNGRFIHAPSKGKRIRIDSLANRYFRRHYKGARSYL